jgi:glycosyltransferase involved in cell wall biosynthesis
MTPIGIGAPWVAVEVHTLQEAGIQCEVTALRKPESTWFDSGWARRIHEETASIYPVDRRFIWSMIIAPMKFRTRYVAALCNALFGHRESVRKRITALCHFFVACHWACGVQRRQIDLVHAQWIHSAGTVGMYGSWLLNVPFSFTGHAVDLFRDRVALRDKIRRAEFIVCISNFHRQFYLDHGASEQQLITVHCGIDVEQFRFRGRDKLRTRPHIVTLGRLVEKKGNEYLVDACGLLRDRGVDIRCTIAGDGPLTESLRSRVGEKGLQESVIVTGKPILQEELADFMQSGDIFVQPCVWSRDNDVDGTPRTLMEAMACGVPSISTRLAGIPDIIEDDKSGLLVPPNDAASLAHAMERLISDPDLVVRLSHGGREKIEREFKLPECIAPLEERFRRILPDSDADSGSFVDLEKSADLAAAVQ